MPADEQFEAERKAQIRAVAEDESLRGLSRSWTERAQELQYSYHFDWLGLPVIQYPQDIVAMQEIVWRVQPDLIVETGIARGGSLIFYASMLELLSICGFGEGTAVGVDIDIRPHNRTAILQHPLARRLHLIEGSSVAEATVAQVAAMADGKERVLVCLDSNHSHAHVLAELRAYAPLASVGSYVVVFDTVVEHLGPAALGGRPWGPGNSPLNAVRDFLTEDDRFAVDPIHEKLQITVAPDGFLKRLR